MDAMVVTQIFLALFSAGLGFVAGSFLSMTNHRKSYTSSLKTMSDIITKLMAKMKELNDENNRLKKKIKELKNEKSN